MSFLMSLLLGLFVLYWLPTLVAILRQTPSALGVAVINFFLGWTVIGWFLAMMMALATRPHERIVIIEGRAREVR
jgi:hypothetical protein